MPAMNLHSIAPAAMTKLYSVSVNNAVRRVSEARQSQQLRRPQRRCVFLQQ